MYPITSLRRYLHNRKIKGSDTPITADGSREMEGSHDQVTSMSCFPRRRMKTKLSTTKTAATE